MEHGEVQALLELAAIEPAGFERLAAGDTAEAAALAGHLAGCPACAAEFAHLGRLAVELRAAVRAVPPADLRQRTLDLVAATGRDRSSADRDGSLAPAAEPPTQTPGIRAAAPIDARRSWRSASRVWMLATAAALVVAVVGAAGWWSARSDLEREQAATARLADVTEASVRVGAQPDARTIELAATGAGGSAKGAIVLSSASAELVVVAEGLAVPAAGTEYRCWIEAGGAREVIGKMDIDAGLATWAGWSEAVATLVPGTRFGVSLVDIDGGIPGEPLLTGQL